MSKYGLDKRAEELRKKRKRSPDRFPVPFQKPKKRTKRNIRQRSEKEEEEQQRNNNNNSSQRREEVIKRRVPYKPQNQRFRGNRNEISTRRRRDDRKDGGRRKRSDWEEDELTDPFLFPDRSRKKWVERSPLTIASRRGDGYRNLSDATPYSTVSRFSREPTPADYNDDNRLERIKGPIYFNDEAVDETDYAWYGGEIGEGMVMDLTESTPFLGNDDKFREKEQRLKRNPDQPIQKRPRIKYGQGPPKHTAQMNDHLRWERNRMKSSGLSKGDRENVYRNTDHMNHFDGEGNVLEEEEDDEDEKEFVIVHEITPPFLDGRVKFTVQESTVTPVVNLSCDMAVSARKGSEVVKQNRLRKDREKAVRDRFRFKDTRLGKMLDTNSLLSHENRLLEDQQNVRQDTRFGNSIKNQKWGGSSAFSRKLSIGAQRKKLPIYRSKNELQQLLQENNVLIIVGETGSGKTTQLTQFCYEFGYKKIGCTQPRRVAAVSVAKRVSEEMGSRLGDFVGYAIRFEDCTSERTAIKYMTDGVLLRETLSQPSLDQYDVIIMDEAHERSLPTDILFGILKRVVAKRRNLKLIVTSATMDSSKFSRFFGGVPIYNIPGRTFPVKTHYTRTPVEDYVDAAVKQALSIHFTTPLNGDILIFMTGQEDIIATCELMEERARQHEENNEEMKGKLVILPIYSLLPSELQAKIFMKAPDGFRKCIVATNIAETSLTVDGIFYVIDCGFCKLKCYNPKVGMDVLQRFPESRAGAKQREGRGGRTGPGFCYRLFTEKQFHTEMLEVTVPEIQRTNLSNTILLLKSLGVNDLLDFDFMDPPPEDNMKKSMFQLYILGALDSSGNLTKLGTKMIEFPLDPTLSKMILQGVIYGCTNEVITVVSMLSVPNLLYRPKSQEEESDSRREKFYVPESDHLTLLNIYGQWKRKGYSSIWCRDNFIHYKGMRKVREIRHQLCDILKKNRIELVTCGVGNEEIIRKCICSGYLHHVAKLEGIGEYVNLLTGLPCSLHPSSSLFGIGYTPQFVVYHELVMTAKEYMRTVSSIRGSWLEDLCPMFYSVKRSNRTHQIRKKEQKEWKEDMEKKMEESQKELEEHKKKSTGKELLSVLLQQKKKKSNLLRAPPSYRSTPGTRTPYRRSGI